MRVDSYAPSPGSEVRAIAIGTAEAARRDIQMVNSGAGTYNSVKSEFTAEAQAEILAEHGAEGLERINRAHLRIMRSAQSWVEEGTASLKASWGVVGSLPVKNEHGFYDIKEFAVNQGGPGWAVTVNSHGSVSAAAGAENVSGEVSRESLFGGVWGGPSGQALDISV